LLRSPLSFEYLSKLFGCVCRVFHWYPLQGI
jgi:hypothetical protein